MNLESIHSPRALDAMTHDELKALAQTLRTQIVETVSKRGGHLASNLGTVELTIALHRAFSCPKDKIIFDVGHQCYSHKLLTGRAAQFDSLRMYNGLCGFPRCEESIYDAYDTGHASTAISAALGMARARDLQNEDYNVIAVIGDGALTGGMCYEALNDAGSTQTRMIIILNDNGMSISGNVGALSHYLTYMRTSKGWITIKRAIANALKRMPVGSQGLYRTFLRFKDNIRNIFVKDKFFSSLAIRYLGPIDGQNIEGLERVLKRAKSLSEPVLIHVVTKKGRGYAPAEDKPDVFHGTPPFCVESGAREASPDAVSFGKHAAQRVMEIAQKDKRVAVVTAAMTDGTGFAAFQKAFPERLFDVGIAEEHAVTYAAGMARAGMRPVVAIYDTFLQRGFDQIVEDVCEQKLPVLFLMDRAALSGHDGSTHHGVFGLSYLCPVPNLQVFCPRTVAELRQMIDYAFSQSLPVAIRYPRAEDKLAEEIPYRTTFHPGQWEKLKDGKDCALLCVGPMNENGLEAAALLKKQGITAQVVNASSIKPLDETLLCALSKENVPMFTLEEHVQSGGFGSRVATCCVQNGFTPPKKIFALPDAFVEHGERDELLNGCGLSAAAIAKTIKHCLKGDHA